MSDMQREKEQTPSDASPEEKLAMRYIDGDLSPKEASDFEEKHGAASLLQKDCDAWQKIGESLRNSMGEQAKAHAFSSDDMFAKIEAEVGAGAKNDDAGAQVSSIADAKSRKRHLEKRVGPRKRTFWIPVTGVLAAAAAWHLFFNPVTKEDSHTPIAGRAAAPGFESDPESVRKKNPFKKDIAYAQADGAAEENAGAIGAGNLGDSGGTEIIEADFSESTGTVFSLEGNAGKPIAVVWIYE